MPPVADRNDVVQAVAAVQRLDLFADPALAVEPDPQPLAHGARPAIATDQPLAVNLKQATWIKLLIQKTIQLAKLFL